MSARRHPRRAVAMRVSWNDYADDLPVIDGAMRRTRVILDAPPVAVVSPVESVILGWQHRRCASAAVRPRPDRCPF